MSNKVYKGTVITLVTIAVGFGLFFGTTIVMDINSSADDEQKVKDEKKNNEKQREVRELSKDKNNETKTDENLNPFGDVHDQSELPENKLQDYIHYMSHQKVEANEKWDFYLITDERVRWLIEAVQKNDYRHGERYSHILNSWKREDFHRADEQHNFIWEIQGGTFGKATGVLSLEEEMNYLESAENIEYGEDN